MTTEAIPARPSRGTRRVRSRSSVLAQGEPMVWLTGGALLMACLMIVGLLGLVVYFGLSTFWPKPLTLVTTLDGQTYLGEVTRSETYRPEPDYVASTPEAYRAVVSERLEARHGQVGRRLLRTGNFRITQKHFSWVDDTVVKDVSYPEWAVTVERLEWGRFYGTPQAFAFINFVPETDVEGRARPTEAIQAEAVRIAEAFAREGKDVRMVVRAYLDGRSQDILVVPSALAPGAQVVGVARMTMGPEAAWAEYNQVHAAVRKRWEEKRHLEKHAIGEINQKMEAARLTAKAAILREEEALNRQGEGSAAHREAEQARIAALAVQQEVDAWGQGQYAIVRQKIDAINTDNGRYQLVMKTAGEGTMPPRETLMRLDEIVLAYPANRLSLARKLGIYGERWWEFLSAEPREANSEGGVMPALFGTVAMTFVMIIVVVPFGVLAALYLREYARAGPIVSAVRVAVNNLAGVPSIVFGVFGLGFFCYGVGSYLDGGSAAPWSPGLWTTWLVSWLVCLGGGILFASAVLSRVTWESSATARAFKGLFMTLWVGAMLAGAFVLLAQIPFFEGFFRASLPNPTYGKGGLLWASLTLALLTLPVVIVATEEALAAVPNSMREGSYACGASKWQTIKRIVLPRAMPGIMTGTVLAMARGAGEVAPLMLVGAVKLAPELPIDGVFPFLHPERSFMHLGFHVYDVGFQSQNSEAAKPMVYTTTMLLISLVVAMNLFAIFFRNRLKRRFVVQAF